MSRIVTLLVMLLVASCTPPQPADRNAAENDIREAVFRHQFDIWKDQGVSAYYLSVGEKATDPSDDLMRRFFGHSPPVKKVGSSAKFVPNILRTGLMEL